MEITLCAKLFTAATCAYIFGIGSIEISVAMRDVEFGSITTCLGQYRSMLAEAGVKRGDSFACVMMIFTLRYDVSAVIVVSSAVVRELLYPLCCST